MLTASNALRIAELEIGYLEKASNAMLDDKTANAGTKNYTKYARDLHKAGFFNGSKNGYAWCAVFVSWVIWKLCDEDKAKAEELLCQTGPYAASCTSAVQYYKQAGRFYTDNPKPGDQIFFWDAGKTYAAHTGIVVDVDDTCVYTIEGNTSAAAGVVENGGCVRDKKYPLNHARIYGYGRPRYDEEPATPTTTPTSKKEEFEVKMKTLKKGDKGAQVKTLQALLIGYGYDCGRTGADGDFGGATDSALRKYQSRNGLTVDGVAGPKTWAKLLAQ